MCSSISVPTKTYFYDDHQKLVMSIIKTVRKVDKIYYICHVHSVQSHIIVISSSSSCLISVVRAHTIPHHHTHVQN